MGHSKRTEKITRTDGGRTHKQERRDSGDKRALEEETMITRANEDD